MLTFMTYADLIAFFKEKSEEDQSTFGYSESHHIIPRSEADSTFDIDNPDNLVLLPFRYHVLAHYLRGMELEATRPDLARKNFLAVQMMLNFKNRSLLVAKEELEKTLQSEDLMDTLSAAKSALSKSLKEKYTGPGNPRYGKPVSKETRAKISQALTGREPTKKEKLAFRKKSIQMAGENNPNFGKPISEETRNKISLALMGKKDSEETKKKKSVARMGKPPANKGKPWTPEQKKRHSEIKMGSPKTRGTTGLTWVNNGTQELFISKEALYDYIESGWRAGKLPTLKRWINNGVVSKRVSPQDLEKYLLAGWVLNRLPFKKYGPPKRTEA